MKISRKRTHMSDSGGRAACPTKSYPLQPGTFQSQGEVGSSRDLNRSENVDLMRRPTEDRRWASKTDREGAIPPVAGFARTLIA
jgi:hypothetical protein